MGRYKSTPEFTVSRELFDKMADTCSARLLWHERIKPPIRWEGDFWVCTSMMLSHSRSWATLYQVIPLSDWGEDTYVFGCFDADWIEQRERSGLFWRGVLVQVEGAPDQLVLGVRVRVLREDNPPPPTDGQSG